MPSGDNAKQHFFKKSRDFRPALFCIVTAIRIIAHLANHSHSMRTLPVTILSSALLTALLASIDVSSAVINPPASKNSVAILPNWSGIWEPANNSAPFPVPAVSATWANKKKTHPNVDVAVDNASSRCVWGMPRLLKSSHTFEVMVMPEQTFFSYDINEFRHVWTDGRKASLHGPVPTGHSVGHWENNVLVIDTSGMQSGLWINHIGDTLSPKATMQERWSQVDQDHLKVDVVIHDTTALAKPFSFSRRYQRLTNTNRMTQKQCFDETHDSTNKDS